MAICTHLPISIGKVMAKAKKETEPSFEEGLAALEELVEQMENGEIALNELVEKYEMGTQLLKSCQKQLKSAEMRVLKLKQDGETLESFED